MSPSPPNDSQPVLGADEVLVQAQELVARGASERAATWQRLHGRMLGLRAAPSKKVVMVHWRRVGLVGSALALGVVLLIAASGHRSSVLKLVSSAELALNQAKMKGRTASISPDALPVAEKSRDPSVNPGRQSSDSWIEVDLRSVGRLFAAPDAVFHLPNASVADDEPSYTVVLDSGELCAQVSHRDVAAQGPFVVQAPGLRAVAVGTRFCVFAAKVPAESWVVVEEGRVRVERAGAEDTLAGGGAVVHAAAASPSASVTQPPDLGATGDVSAKGPAVPRTVAGAGTPCAAAPVAERERCLWRQAGGAGLAAQNGLYLLGVMARDQQHDGEAALAIWRTYQHRFPQGVLAVEASWNVFEELVAEHRFDEALSSSEEFIKEHGDFFRAGELRLRRAEILRDTLGRPADAEAEYQQVLSRESRLAVRDEALFGLARCQERLNQPAEARASFELYRREFPTGKHLAEVARRLEAENQTR